jgi:hypothetical protein
MDNGKHSPARRCAQLERPALSINDVRNQALNAILDHLDVHGQVHDDFYGLGDQSFSLYTSSVGY